MSNKVITYQSPDGELIGQGSIELLPGFQCSLGWSHNAWIVDKYWGQGWGSIVHAARLEWARKRGFKHLMCSVRSDNIKQRKILAKHGWVKIYDMATYCSTVEIWAINLFPNDVETCQEEDESCVSDCSCP